MTHPTRNDVGKLTVADAMRRILDDAADCLDAAKNNQEEVDAP